MFAGKSKIFLLNPDLTNCYIKWNFHCIIKKLCLLKYHCVILKILQTSSLIGCQALSRALIGWGHQAFTIMLNQFYKTNGSLEKYIWKFWRILNLAWGGMYGAISRCLTDKLSIGTKFTLSNVSNVLSCRHSKHSRLCHGVWISVRPLSQFQRSNSKRLPSVISVYFSFWIFN